MFGCDIIIDKLAGPEIAVGPKLEAKAGLTFAPLEKDPVDFKASVDFSFAGEVGAKIKVWKWELAEWNVDLDFGLNKNLFTYPSDNADNEVLKNAEDVKKNAQILLERKEMKKLGKKLDKDEDILACAKEHLRLVDAFNNIPYVYRGFQREVIIRSVLEEYAETNGRYPKNNDADFQTMKRITLDKIEHITRKELSAMFKKYPCYIYSAINAI